MCEDSEDSTGVRFMQMRSKTHVTDSNTEALCLMVTFTHGAKSFQHAAALQVDRVVRRKAKADYSIGQ